MKAMHLGLLAGAAAVLAGAARSGPPNAVDVTRSHGFKSSKVCTFQPAGEKLFAGLEGLRYKKSLRITRELGGLVLAIDGRSSSVPDPSGGSDNEDITVATPVRPVRWHGLPVRSFAAGSKQAAESDLQSWREIRLDATPAQARALLRRLGVTVPASGYQSVDSSHHCGGSVSVESKAGVTAITCSEGC